MLSQAINIILKNGNFVLLYTIKVNSRFESSSCAGLQRLYSPFVRLLTALRKRTSQLMYDVKNTSTYAEINFLNTIYKITYVYKS